VPFVSIFIVPVLFLTLAMLPLWPKASELGFNIIDKLFELLFSLLETLSALPFSTWETTLNSPAIAISIILATALLLLPRGLPLKPLAVIGFFPLLLQQYNPIKHGEFKLTLLDVGQGLSTVIQTQHHVLIFDTGAKFSEQFNAGQAVLVPFLKHQNINHIDTLIISHADNDHIGGTESLLSTYSANRILTSQPQYLENSQPCLAGQSWQWDSIHFEILSPESKQSGSKNNLSCVLKVSNGEHSVLLPGDIEKQTERKLVQHYPKKLASTVLIAPHHGSNTSSTMDFIDTVNPSVVLFPTAYLNRYHFPSKKVQKRYENRHIPSYSTGRSGALSIHFQPNKKLKIMSYREQSKKIWTSVPTD